MERRGFIRGLFGGIVGTGIVVTASAEEIEQFASPLALDTPMVVDAPQAHPTSCGDHLYNDRGELVAIVTQVSAVFSGNMQITAESVGNKIEISGNKVRLINPR